MEAIGRPAEMKSIELFLARRPCANLNLIMLAHAAMMTVTMKNRLRTATLGTYVVITRLQPGRRWLTHRDANKLRANGETGRS